MTASWRAGGRVSEIAASPRAGGRVSDKNYDYVCLTNRFAPFHTQFVIRVLVLVAALCQCGDRAVPVLMAAVLLFDRYPPGLTYLVIQAYVWGDAEAIATLPT